jgi:hypothetical protein
MDDLKRTPEVAQEVGTTAKYVNTILSRHNRLRPARKIGADYWWTREEIEALKRYRESSRRGQPKKVST